MKKLIFPLSTVLIFFFVGCANIEQNTIEDYQFEFENLLLYEAGFQNNETEAEYEKVYEDLADLIIAYDDLAYCNTLNLDSYANQNNETLNALKIPVLLYHHILPDALNTTHRQNAAVISLEDFEAQMNYLYTNGFTAITLTQLENFLLNEIPLPERSVMIHFDDGYYSTFVYAMPVLERYGFVAQLFLIGLVVYDRGDTQPPMNHEGLTFASAITIEGTEHVFETANHTFAKHHLVEGTQYSAFVYYDRETIKKDLIRGFDFVNDHRAFAYPRGQYSDETIEILEYLGITMAFTTQSGYVTMLSDTMLLPRFIIFPNTTSQQFSNIVNGFGL